MIQSSGHHNARQHNHKRPVISRGEGLHPETPAIDRKSLDSCIEDSTHDCPQTETYDVSDKEKENQYAMTTSNQHIERSPAAQEGNEACLRMTTPPPTLHNRKGADTHAKDVAERFTIQTSQDKDVMWLLNSLHPRAGRSTQLASMKVLKRLLKRDHFQKFWDENTAQVRDSYEPFEI